MTTFAELRSRLTPPTEAEVAATIRAELAALATEFATKSDVTPFGWTGEAAKRLMRRACAEMHKGHSYTMGTRTITTPDLSDLIAAYEDGSDELTRQAFRSDRDDYIDEAADALVLAAEDLAGYWREHKAEVAA